MPVRSLFAAAIAAGACTALSMADSVVIDGVGSKLHELQAKSIKNLFASNNGIPVPSACPIHASTQAWTRPSPECNALPKLV